MNIFDDETNGRTQNTIDDLVGEGKKFKTVDDLVNGYANAQRHISVIEDENRTAREEIAVRLSVEEQLAKAQSRNAGNNSEQSNNPPVTEKQPAVLSDEDLAKRIREVTSSISKEDRATSNTQTVADRLVQIYGSEENAAKVVREKASDLGVSVKFLQEVGAQSPKAFYAQLGIDSNARPNEALAPRSEVNSEALRNQPGNGQQGTYEYYKQMRRENPSKYWSTPMQQQQMRDAKRTLDSGGNWGSAT